MTSCTHGRQCLATGSGAAAVRVSVCDGGREGYYWDSYWIVKGLLACGMHSTARGTLLNFAHFIGVFGSVAGTSAALTPSASSPTAGARTTSRAASHRCSATWSSTIWTACTTRRCCRSCCRPCSPSTQSGWIPVRRCGRVGDGPRAGSNLTVEVDGWTLNRYQANTSLPRPESYLEDVALAQSLGLDAAQARQLYRQLASGAESGVRRDDVRPVTQRRVGLQFALVCRRAHAGLHPHVRYCAGRPECHHAPLRGQPGPPAARRFTPLTLTHSLTHPSTHTHLQPATRRRPASMSAARPRVSMPSSRCCGMQRWRSGWTLA